MTSHIILQIDKNIYSILKLKNDFYQIGRSLYEFFITEKRYGVNVEEKLNGIDMVGEIYLNLQLHLCGYYLDLALLPLNDCSKTDCVFIVDFKDGEFYLTIKILNNIIYNDKLLNVKDHFNNGDELSNSVGNILNDDILNDDLIGDIGNQFGSSNSLYSSYDGIERHTIAFINENGGYFIEKIVWSEFSTIMKDWFKTDNFYNTDILGCYILYWYKDKNILIKNDMDFNVMDINEDDIKSIINLIDLDGKEDTNIVEGAESGSGDIELEDKKEVGER